MLGLHDLRLEGGQWPYPDLHAFVRDKGAFMVLNHPFRFNPKIEIDYRRFPPYAVEAYSSNILNSLRPRILEVAEEIGAPFLQSIGFVLKMLHLLLLVQNHVLLQYSLKL